MKTVMLRHVEVGVGAPKVIVPIVGKTQEEILAKAHANAEHYLLYKTWYE